jgi:hypothetical protein
MCHPKWVGSNHTFQSADKLNSTAVLAGLMRIADDPGILSVKVVPVSLWLRSDPDETTGEDDGNTVVRICTQGHNTNDTVSVRDRVSASHPVHYELCAADDKPPSLDLSVFGTPAGVSDEDIIEGWNVENFAYTDVGKVTEFGRFEQELPDSTVTPSRRVCHVYLYVKVSRLSVELYAIFANDGRAVKPLEKTPFDKALQNGDITTKWKKYQGVRLRIVRLKQVARPETLSTNPRQPSTSRSEQLEATTDDDTDDNSPSDGSAVQLDVIQVSQRSRKRTSSLSKSGQAQQRKLSRLPVTGRRPHSNEDELDSRSTDEDESGSEMVL